METISTQEYADIHGCSRQNVLKMIGNGKIDWVREKNNLKKVVFRIPLAALSKPELQQYYMRQSNNIQPTCEKLRCTTKSLKPLDSFTAEEREEIDFWISLLKHWQEFRNSEEFSSKMAADAAFIACTSKEYANIILSTDILYRKMASYKKDELEGLIDRRGKAKKGSCSITPYVKQIFNTFWLEEGNRYPLNDCVKYTELYIREKCDCPEDHLPLPSLSTFRRYTLTIPQPIENLGRNGRKAHYDSTSRYIKRIYDDLMCNDVWFGDTHTFDVITLDQNGNQHRLYLSAFMDARTGVFVGYNITENPGSQSTLLALRDGIRKYGIPQYVYVDNGREFLTFDIGGRGHRAKKTYADGTIPFEPPGVFTRMGIKMINAIPKNARAKPIERRFLDVKNQLSRLFDTFTGGTVVEKPDKLKRVLKSGKIPTDDEFRLAVKNIIEGDMNRTVYSGPVVRDRGKVRLDIFTEEYQQSSIRKATEADLNLLLMRTTQKQKVNRRGVRIDIGGAKVDFVTDDFLMHWMGKYVYLRYDPDNLRTVRAYTLEDQFIAELPQDTATTCTFFENTEKLANANRILRQYDKTVRASVEASKLPIADRESALALVNAAATKELYSNPMELHAKTIQMIRTNEEPLLQAVGQVDTTRMLRNATKNNQMEDELE